MERLFIILTLLAIAHARISVMYAHDKNSDIVAKQCLNEMYSKIRRVDIQESDEYCIIYCVLKKFGIMNTSGAINLQAYRRHVATTHQMDQRTPINDYGSACIESVEATQHAQDVCKKAKAFNDCTHLYKILLN